LGRHEEAEALLRPLLATSTAPDSEADEALARSALETFRFGAASEAIERWRRDAPHAAKPYLWRADLERRTDSETAVVIRDYEEALRRDPTCDLARLGLAEMLRQSHRSAEAVAHYTAYLDHRPDDAVAHLGLGRTAAELGDEPTALRHLDRALELAPNDPQALVERALLGLRRGALTESLAFLDRAARADPFEPEIHYRRGLVLQRLGRHDEARAEQAATDQLREELRRMDAIRQGLLRDPNNRDLQAEAARWLITHGHPDEGLRWAQRVLRAQPSHAATNRLLADYYQGQGNFGLANFYRLQVSSADSSAPAP
jgi:Flp pilus assembly protein TadD